MESRSINFDQFFQDINTNKLLDNDINHNLQKGFISNSNGLIININRIDHVISFYNS